MAPKTFSQAPATNDIGIYKCEVHLKFNLLEEGQAITDRGQLLELLLDAFLCGADEYLEPIHIEAKASPVSELAASPQMRRQLIRLRNSRG
ncbi:Npun_R1517 family heterocyst differentiation transcriptional regulator [Trichothermofontia sp.]